MMEHKIEIFVSYSHHDEGLKDELLKHLSILSRTGIISAWHDREIIPGSDLDQEINEHLDSAAIILLLVSPDFMASDYCFNTEMEYALKRHKSGLARVIPIILRKTEGWNMLPIGKLMALPTDGYPVTLWSDKDNAFSNIAKGISETIEGMGLRNTIIINGTQELQNKDWKFYNNTRFGFSVLVPGNWIIGLESDNGDGVELYIGNPNINICVFASFYIKDVSSSYDNINKPGYRMQRLILDNGLEAELIIGKLSNKVSLEMIQILKNIEYHFNAFITDEFFHDNEKTLIDIIKSYDALKDGWEKGECISANFN